MTDHFTKHQAKIREQAAAGFPLETVWLITKKGCTVVKNIHEDPENFFEVSVVDLAAAAKKGLLAVVHSHPNGVAAPSYSDMEGQISSGVPWGVLATDGDYTSPITWWGDGAPKAPLVGRGFCHGVTDCYALIKDYYQEEKGIRLPEFPRSWLWWLKGGKGFSGGFESAGFIKIEEKDARPGDVWLAQLRSEVPNHGGVLLEHGVIMHQAGSSTQVDPSKLSIREPLHRYQHLITHWLRHVGERK